MHQLDKIKNLQHQDAKYNRENYYYLILEELFYAICGAFLISVILTLERNIHGVVNKFPD